MKKKVVRVTEVQPQGDRSLVLGVEDGGERVSFHLPAEQAAVMDALLRQGEIVAAELPDDDDDSDLVVTSDEVVEVRAPRLN